jgi:hypothetical protein
MANYRDRTPQDICLLCQRKKGADKAYSTATNSHFTPMGMIQSNTGRRHFEMTVSINLTSGEEHLVHYGRSNLDNTNTEITQDPHMANYIFCQECEDKLSEVEDKVIPVLNQKLRNPNQAQNFQAERISDDVTYKECIRVAPLEFKLFVYSIIWRQNLQQQLEFKGQGILSKKTESLLRKAITSGLYDGWDKNQLLVNCLPFSMITSENFTNPTEHYINPYPIENYPIVFCVNEYLVLLYDQSLNLPESVYHEELDNTEEEPIRIVFVPDHTFGLFQTRTHEISGNLYMRSIAKVEFHFALMNTFQNLQIDPSFSFLDSEISEEQKKVAAQIISSSAEWTTVEGRKMTRFKLVKHYIPSRQKKKTPVYMGLLEIRNLDGNLYHRLGFYGKK